MTPFGEHMRALRAARGMTLKQFAADLQVSSAYVSALEHGRRGVPSAGLVHQICEVFGLIWEEADELTRLARLSHPRIVVNTAGLSPAQTALANRLARGIRALPPDTIAEMHRLLNDVLDRPIAPKRTQADPTHDGHREGDEKSRLAG